MTFPGEPFPLAKAHSKTVAAELARLGWTLKSEFRVEHEGEPYEYLFEWKHNHEPIRPSTNLEGGE